MLCSTYVSHCILAVLDNTYTTIVCNSRDIVVACKVVPWQSQSATIAKCYLHLLNCAFIDAMRVLQRLDNVTNETYVLTCCGAMLM